MMEIKLNSNNFKITFSHTNDFGQKRQYDEISIINSSQSRLYCMAMKEGVKYTRISKKMLFDKDGYVYLKFGKNKLVIGEYKEL